MSATRSPRTATRLTAAALSAGLAVLVPLFPAAAWSQAGSSGQPPPVDLSLSPASDTGSASGVISQKTQCVGSLDQGTQLESAPWGQDRLAINQVHGLGFDGTGMTVAVIDTGVNRHPWLKNLEGIGDYVQNTPKGPGLEDCDGHGTEVAGIIAADTPGDIGFKGVAPKATILSIRQSSSNYEETESDGQKHPAGDLGTLAQAIRRAAERPEVDVVNISIDTCRLANTPINTAERVLQRTLHFAVVERDKVIVNSAGNLKEPCTDAANGPNPRQPIYIVTPAWFSEYVLSVAAVDANGAVAEFSIQGPWVNIAAPGTDIISLNPAGNGLANTSFEGGSQHPIQGTSFAAPYVAGVATLVRQKFPELSALQVMKRIQFTAMHPGAPGGRDNRVGFGMIDPIAALTAMVPSEFDIPPARPVSLPSEGLAPDTKNWTPALVALIGSGSGLALLGITLFTVHTVRRNRGDGRPDAAIGSRSA